MFGMIHFGGQERQPQPAKQSPTDMMERDFMDFAGLRRATSDQLESAYMHVTGADEGEMTDPAVSALYQEMDRLIRSGYPLNRFARMITIIREHEAVDALPDDPTK